MSLHAVITIHNMKVSLSVYTTLIILFATTTLSTGAPCGCCCCGGQNSVQKSTDPLPKENNDYPITDDSDQKHLPSTLTPQDEQIAAERAEEFDEKYAAWKEKVQG